MMFSQLVKQSSWCSADYISTCIFLVCNLLLKRKIHKIPIKLIRTRVTVWPSNNSIHSFFESLLMPERNENKPNYIEKKKSTVKTRSTLGKQQARETRGGLDSEGIIKLRFRTIKEQRIIIDMIPNFNLQIFFPLGKQMH